MSPDVLACAKRYPYPIPDESFVIVDAAVRRWDDLSAIVELTGRRPILAVGSNQAPEQLIRKFGEPHWGPIPVTRAHLRHFDVVYSPHISSYGAIPATLHPSPDTVVSLFVTWLDRGQEERMHATEVATANYGFGELRGIDLALETGTALDRVFVYWGSRGALNRNGTPVPLAEVPAAGRRWSALSQVEVQTHVRDRLAPGHDLDAFILAAVADAALRGRRTATLARDAHPFVHNGFAPIPV